MEHVTTQGHDSDAPIGVGHNGIAPAYLANPLMSRRTLLGAAAVLGGLGLANGLAGTSGGTCAYAGESQNAQAEAAGEASAAGAAEIADTAEAAAAAAAEEAAIAADEAVAAAQAARAAAIGLDTGATSEAYSILESVPTFGAGADFDSGKHDAAKLAEEALVAGNQGAQACYESNGKPYQGEGHTQGNDFIKYPVFYGEKDEFGFHLLSEQARGCRLAYGYSYRVNRNLALEPRQGESMSALVADNNLIFVDANCTLTVRGSNAGPGTVALPGIALYGEECKGYAYTSIISSLIITGGGNVRAYGGDAGDGIDGKPAQEAWHDDNLVYSGCGGDGGAGGHGAGAGIGTAGGTGGSGGMGGRYVTSEFRRFADDKSGDNGNFKSEGWGDPGPIWNPGELCLAGDVCVQAFGGKMSTYRASGGKASSWQKYKSEWITKHLTGGSGGGGGGGAGGGGNGYGKGGIGGAGGGGGGSAGAMWRTVGTSDDPPTAEGGRGGGNLESTTIVAGDGEGRVRYISGTRCHGGNGGRAGVFLAGLRYSPDSTRFPVYVFGKAATNSNLPKNPFPYEMAPCGVPGARADRYQATKVFLSSYTGFAHILENGGWYIKNQLFNADGKGTQSREFITIAGVTEEKDVLAALSDNPPSREGFDFLGWAFADDASKLVYDAQTGKLDTALLVERKKVIARTGKGALWMCPVRTELAAVWKDKAPSTYSVVYHTNGGSFADLSGKAVTGESYAEAGHDKGAAVTLWNNSATGTIGIYLLKPPADMPASTLQKGWALKVDKEGYAAGTVYALGETVANLNPKGQAELDLYAVWKEEDDKSRQ